MTLKKRRIIQTKVLARVEGEGSLYVKLDGDRVEAVRLKIFEPPRFFEAFLRGRDFREAPDITARICGICPIAYELGASLAMENVCGVSVTEPIRELRKLIYYGEWIESHVLHVFMLHAPDFLGYEDAIAMAKDHPDLVNKALRLKKIGNDIMVLLGGREIHPINLKVGGFYKVPSKETLSKLIPDLQWGLETSQELAKAVARFDFPSFTSDYEFIALKHPKEYAIVEGNLYLSKGFDVPISAYDTYLEEFQVQHSTALHTRVRGRAFAHVGPLARFATNFDFLADEAKEAASACGLNQPCTNPYQSILVRLVEVIHAFSKSIEIVRNYREPDEASVPVKPRAGTGHGCTEAPRGICYHQYTIDEGGIITNAKIVSPTAVNQATIEKDLFQVVENHTHESDQDLRSRCEQTIRNYDPCISCSAHFLKLDVDRGKPHEC